MPRWEISRLGVAVTISKGLAMPSEVVFKAASNELLKVRLAAQRGVQTFTLSQPAAIQELSLHMLSAVSGEQVWGSLSEIEGYDREGRNALLSRLRQVPVYAWIETSKGGQWTGDLDRQKDVRPEHIRVEVWMSICRGATGIGYFTLCPLAHRGTCVVSE